MADLAILKTELTTDPKDLGYDKKDPKGDAALLNAETQSVGKESLTSGEIFNQVDLTELKALSAANRVRMDRILGLSGNLPVQGNIKTEVFALFAKESKTRKNFSSAIVQNISRGTELGLGTVSPGLILEARSLS